MLASLLADLHADIARLQARAAKVEAMLSMAKEEVPKRSRPNIFGSNRERKILEILQGAGDSGAKLIDIAEELHNFGILIDKKTVSSYLTRMKGKGLVRSTSIGRWYYSAGDLGIF